MKDLDPQKKYHIRDEKGRYYVYDGRGQHQWAKRAPKGGARISLKGLPAQRLTTKYPELEAVEVS